MARKRGDAAIMQEVESQEEWEDMISKEGLWVIDVYQDWAGPCNAMVANFRRMKNELGDELLHFAVAKADTIEFLSLYRGRCEPCFLYYAGGVLVGVVHGANAPLILRTLTEQLKAEHAVLDGKAERKRIRDPIIVEMEEAEKKRQESIGVEEEEEDNVLRYNEESVMFGETLEVSQEHKQVTLAIIKPDAVRLDKVDEIMEQIKGKGIEVVAHEERSLTEEEAREFYSHLKDEEYFEDLVAFMTSGPCHVMVLTKGTTGETIVQDWRELIGPTDVDEAKEVEPESLRAKFGTQSWMNALHGSDGAETAAREMAFFFPDLAVPAVPGSTKKKGAKPVQRTLALIRPDAFRTRKDEILERIKEAGFSIALSKEMTLTREQAEEFYKEHKDEDYFQQLIDRMTSGPLLALGLAREDAVVGWREMLGPKEVDVALEEAPESLRAQFAVEDVEVNQLHGSDSQAKAQEELSFFFPMQQTVAVIKPDAIGTQEAIVDKIHEAGFKIAARKETTITRDIAEKFYEDLKDKDYYNELVEHMTSGPTMFMVLSKEDAVENWRKTIGPTDPNVAKEEAPESLRATFGTDVLKNAIHGSSNPEHAQKAIETIFGHLEFDKDGNVKEKPATEPAEQAEVKSTAGEGQEEPKPEPGGEGGMAVEATGAEETAAETTQGDQKSEADRKSLAGEEQDKEEQRAEQQQQQQEEKQEDEQKEDKKEDEQKEEDKKDDDKRDDDDRKDDDKRDDDDRKDDDGKDDDDKKEDDKKEDDKTESDKKEEEEEGEQKRKTPSPDAAGKSSPEAADKPGSPKTDKPEDDKKKAGEQPAEEAAPEAEDKPAEEG